jgi:hypothetical protein
MIIKKLTEELIIEKLEKTGISEYYTGTEVQVNNIYLHFDFKLTDDYNSPNFLISSQTTYDGYEVWVAHEPSNIINIEEDVHYYDSDLGERLEQFVRRGWRDTQIYIDDLDQHWIEEAMAGLWDDVYEKQREDMEYALELEGYEYED